MKLSIINFLFLLAIASLTKAETGKPMLRLWFEQPAKEWMESTPVGNGRLGAIISGGISNDRNALNEITLTSNQTPYTGYRTPGWTL